MTSKFEDTSCRRPTGRSRFARSGPSFALCGLCCASSPPQPPNVASGRPSPSPELRTHPPDTEVPSEVSALDTKARDERLWARQTFGEALEGLNWGTLAHELVAWVPPGETILGYLTAGEYRCAEVELARVEDAFPPEDDAGPVEYRARHLIGRILAPVSEVVDGVLVRKFESASVGEHLSFGNGGGTLAWDPDRSTWSEASGFGIGEPPRDYGVVSVVTPEVVRFAGEEVRLRALCFPRYTQTRCRSDDGWRWCAACAPWLTVERVGPQHGYGFPGPPRSPEPTCDETCPEPVLEDTPEFVRLRSAVADVVLWRPKEPEDGEPIPSLYRNKDDCEARR